ncbi:MAG: hypothetical protein ABUS56_13575 [Acidobacteriota bacterium]|jgi:hypothetical protein
MSEHVYRPDVLRAIERYGLHPTPQTSPALARGFVRDLYCYELRVLRARMLRDEFPKQEYAARVIALRDNYRVLSLRASEWAT